MPDSKNPDMREDFESWCPQIARYLLNADYRWCRWQREFLGYMAFNPPTHPSEHQTERLRHLAKRLLNERLKSDGSLAEPTIGPRRNKHGVNDPVNRKVTG